MKADGPTAGSLKGSSKGNPGALSSIGSMIQFEIHHAFDSTKSLEVRAIFLIIVKAFDKLRHDGLIFKMRQNGVSGRLVKLFQSYLNNRKQRVVLNGCLTEYSNLVPCKALFLVLYNFCSIENMIYMHFIRRKTALNGYSWSMHNLRCLNCLFLV